MIIQEKEWTVESGIVTVEFYAEYSKGFMEDLSIRLSVDDMYVRWSANHSYNELPIMYMGKMTKDYFRLNRLINSNLVSLISKSITQNLNINTK